MKDHFEDIDLIAAEYVVGTLDGEERQAVAEQRQTNSDLNQAILDWEARLAPLLDGITPVQPPSRLYQKIKTEIEARGNARAVDVISLDAHRNELKRRVRPWRAATGVMTAMAASLAGILVLSPPKSEMPSPKYVAVLQEGAQSPAFLMTIDMKSHMCAIKMVTKPAQPGKAYELWMVHEAWDKPRSLGLIARNDMEVMPMAEGVNPDLYMDATFAVSLEPDGGSPTGQPTGEIMYAGRLVQSVP